ncbi:hypothetical protein POM88_023531 [Heracleum sosnowskyi]|uniref:Oberon coiled-coil region domain-containing protein n=1 Tax=Heracleum sosnowskyi TaxID=360622 RepID=A0AAD8IJ15_9APIA|nr:hypothetical protein POM88_023531 [Heracleum sosnowskyi]
MKNKGFGLWIRGLRFVSLGSPISCTELKDKAREVAALKMDRQRKKQQIDELDSIVRLKQAEADMFDLKASEARRESERIQRIVLAKSEKSEEDYVYIGWFKLL